MADSAGVLFGADVSHWQETMNVGLLPVDYVIARTAQAPGGRFQATLDRAYVKHKANTLAAGKLFSSYFYLGSGKSAEGNVALHESVEPDRAVPLMLDWEEGSGNADFLKACYGAFTNAGYHVWGTYAPKWYWQMQGSRDLSGLPPLVSSRYADNKPGSIAAEYASTPEAYWLGYGNLPVGMLQYSSSVRMQPYPNNDVDGDAFKGTRAQLADWWNPTAPNPELPIEGSDVSLIAKITMPASPTTTSFPFRNLPGGSNCKIVIRPRGAKGNKPASNPVWIGNIFAWGNRNVGVGHNPKQTPGFDARIDTVWEWGLPGALWADMEFSCNEDVDVEIYG